MTKVLNYDTYKGKGRPRKKDYVHSNFFTEVEMQKPKDKSNLYVGIAVGVMVTLCGVIYVGVSYLEAVMY